MYSSHYRIIKCVDFKTIHYVINMDSLKFLTKLIMFFYQLYY